MLSLGERQRLGLARGIMHAPDYLFIDEATASLDEPAEASSTCSSNGCRPPRSYRSAIGERWRRSIVATCH
jgi:ABC-type protease/lipase transport system fused ATPase/permease subunit